jgi:hypothetical protein
MKGISNTEKLVFMGLITYPDRKDTEIADLLSLPNSTFASVKARIMEEGFLDEIYIPVFPKLGFELLAAVYSDFNPSVSVEERIANTRRTVEVYPEMVLSMGESHRGFSVSVAENITRIMRISHQRMKILADLNLLEIELPREVLFPFEMSTVHRFFNLAPLLYAKLSGENGYALKDIPGLEDDIYRKDPILQIETPDSKMRPLDVELTRKQLEILYYIIKYPDLSASKLSTVIPFSRHTISRVKDMLIEEGYLACSRIPDLSKLGYSMLSLYHVKMDPKRPIEPEVCRRKELLQDDTVFLVSRPTELMMLAVYENYPHYNRGMSMFNQFLKGEGYMSKIPNIRNHSLSEAVWIKRFVHHPLIKEAFHLDVK